MDICIYHVDGSGSVTLFNVVGIDIDEGEIYINCISTDLDGYTCIDRHCYYISDVKKIEVLKLYDYRYV